MPLKMSRVFVSIGTYWSTEAELKCYQVMRPTMRLMRDPDLKRGSAEGGPLRDAKSWVAGASS
jgi:hypothetical protein